MAAKASDHPQIVARGAGLVFFLKDLPSRRMIEGYGDRFSPGSEASIEQALIMMRNASVLVRRIDLYFAANGLSQLRFLIMIVIDREIDRDWLTQAEIAEKLDVSKPVMTRTVQTLLKAGLLSVEADKEDRRIKRLSLTSDGQALLFDLLPGYFDTITSFMASPNAH